MEASDDASLSKPVRIESALNAWKLGKKENSAPMQVDAALKLGELYLSFSQYNEAIFWLQKALILAKKNEQSRDMGLGHNNAAMAYYQLAIYDSVEYHFQQAISCYQNDESQGATVAAITLNLGMLKHRQGVYDEALSHYHAALQQFEETGNTTNEAVGAHNIALVHQEINQLHDAIKYFRRSITLWKFIGDSTTVAVAMDNLAACFLELENVDSAKIYTQEAISLNKASENNHWLASNYSRLGEVYLQEDNLPMAKSNFQQALTLRKQLKEPAGIASESLQLARVYSQAGTIDSALEYTSQAYTTAIKLKLTAETFEASRLLLDIHLAQNDDETGKGLLKEMLSLRDSLVNEEVLSAISDAEIRYASQKKAQALKMATIESELKTSQIKTRNKALISLGVVLLILVIGTGAIYRLAITRKQANIALSKANNRIELLLKDQNHRVKNELQKVGDIIALSQLHVENNDAKSILQEHLNRIHALNLVHRKLFQGTNENSIRLPDFLQELVDQLVFSYGLRQIVRPNLQIMDIEMPTQQAMTLSLILNEWVSNSLKYATRQERPGLGVSLASEGENYQLSVRDNGPGLNNTSKGFGLQLVDKQASLLNGSVSYTYDDGLLQTLVFPKTLPS